MIDVPGHKELVRNMLSGASLADAAILIISAREDEGLQDETRLHIYLARLLGIKQLVVAVNKMDAARYSEKRFMEIRNGLGTVLEGFGFAKDQISFIPVSAKSGDNVMERSAAMQWYQGRPLLEFMEEFAGKDAEAELCLLPGRMFVQDVYTVGSASVIVGKVESGAFSRGEEIVIGPGGIRAKIEELHGGGGAKMETASAGQNVGMKLSGSAKITRGNVCMSINNPIAPANKIRARIFCLPEAQIKSGESITITCASQESGAKITKVFNKFHPINDRTPKEINGQVNIGSSEAAEAEIETEKEIMVERFSEVPPMGRFIISSKGKIAGVGVVI
jgi:elongation factor 1-alpha